MKILRPSGAIDIVLLDNDDGIDVTPMTLQSIALMGIYTHTLADHPQTAGKPHSDTSGALT